MRTSIALRSLFFLAAITACTGCVSRSEYEKLEARIDFLEAQLVELQHLPDRLLAKSKQALDQKDYAKAFEIAGQLIERHPESPEAKQVAILQRVTENTLYSAAWSLPATDFDANIKAYSDLASLNPSQPLYREKVAYYTQRKQTKTRSARSTNTSSGKGYTNSQGQWVPSPAYSPSAPAGASAKCRDGTYSFSQSRRGTCSHHGGVASWL